MKVRLVLAATALVAWLLINACGGGGGGSGSGTGSGNSTNHSLIWDSGQWDNSTWS